MIQVYIHYDEHGVNEIRSLGHAMYDDYGKDIVCAGVTTAIVGGINAIYEMGLIAFHEVMHVVLANVDKNKSQAPVHAAIVNMENNIFPYIYKGSLEEIKREFF